MAKMELLVPTILKWEGGFVNHPADKGGATNKGITIGTFTHYRKQKGLPAPSVDELKNIANEEWMDILKTLYWDKWQADKLSSQAIANLLVDWVWASGAWGIKYPQQVLGVAPDGVVGAVTLAAVNGYADQQELFRQLWQRRLQHFEDIARRDASQRVFLKGWLNRLNDFKFYV
jgi:lysozyme family protein